MSLCILRNIRIEPSQYRSQCKLTCCIAYPQFQTKKGNQQNYAAQTAPPMQQAPMQYGQQPVQPQGQGYAAGVMQPPPPSGQSQY